MFSHLHVHTEFSLLDGLSRIGPLVRRAKELEMTSLAITDHGALYGAIDFYKTATEAGIKPIIGCEMYVAPGSHLTRAPEVKSSQHLTVLATNDTGYKNLVKLVTRAHLDGYYYKPRVDRDLLQQHNEGLVVLSGCPSGEVPGLIAQGRMEEARTSALWYKEVFDNYYLEVMEHGGVPQLPEINRGLVDLHRELEIPLVATNDSHYVGQDQAPLQDILICIHTNTNVQDESRLRMTEDSYYLKSHEEMMALFPELPDAVENTQAIAEMCELELDFSQLRLPQYPVPDGVPADEYLTKLCWDGLKRRLEPVTPEAERRLASELEVIKQTQFSNYFLVVWDIARFVRERDILLAVRGSAAASLVLFSLEVTDINPLDYDLVFERFLNVERKELPDIDMDFQDDRRGEVINFVVSKYGRDHVAQIITFGTLGARASIRDVGRALAMPYADVDMVARLIPFRLNIKLDDALATTPELREVYDADEGVKTLVDTARQLEGLSRHSSTHAAGVVISEEPLDDYVPLQRPVKGDDQDVNMTQYSMDPIAALGLLKLDFLGLSNLTILARVRALLSRDRGIDLALEDIPLDDADTFDLLSRGETVGVFQLEGSGMTRYIKDLKPSSLGDVAAMIALYRPGPMEHISTFIDAKFGRVEPNYPHPALQDILKETYGVIVYQDQVLQIARTFAGYSLGEADIVRKAMGKKIPEIMAREREKFLSGALDQGYAREVAEQIFALIEPFAGYAFNKAHSVSYGLISYWTAYLKAHYPAEYMVSLLNTYSGNSEKVGAAAAECQRLKIPVLSPDINGGEEEFSIVESEQGRRSIRFGMAAVKNVGATAVRPIIEAREKEGPFESIEHMCRVADATSLGRKALESLIKVGTFDSMGDRGALLTAIDRILSLAQSEATLRQSDQTSMFDLFGESVPTPLSSIDLPDVVASEGERREWETELLGVDLSGASSLASLAADMGSEVILSRGEIDVEMAGKKSSLAGQIRSVTERFTKDQRPFKIANLGLLDGSIDVFVWENVLEETSELWQEGRLVTLVGTVRARGDQVSISCISAEEYRTPSDEEESVAEADVPVEGPARVAAADEALPASNGRAIPDSGVPSVQPQPAPVGQATAGEAPAELEVEETAEGVNGAAPPPRRLRLRIRETDDTEGDQDRLEEVRRLLLEFPGQDEVGLEVASNGQVVTLAWDVVRVGLCDELEQGIRAIIGEAGMVSVEDKSP